MMRKKVIRKKLKKIISKYSFDGIEINDNSELINDLGIDSLSYIGIISEVEDAFGIDISMDYLQMEKRATFFDLLALIEHHYGK